MNLTFKGTPCHTSGDLPARNTTAPHFRLVNADLGDVTLHEFHGKRKLIATVPSLDTGVCSTMTKRLNDHAKKHHKGVILVVSADLPFAQKRFCGLEGVHDLKVLSMMRDKEFAKSYGLLIVDGLLAGLIARSLIVVDEKDRIVYTQLVSEITQEPQYEEALHLLSV